VDKLISCPKNFIDHLVWIGEARNSSSATQVMVARDIKVFLQWVRLSMCIQQSVEIAIAAITSAEANFRR
jgi:hypothetical protein